MGPSSRRGLRLLFTAFLLVVSAAAPPRAGSRSPTPSTADAVLASMCDPRNTRPGSVPPLSPCRGMHLRRHHHHRPPLPLPPPGHGGEEEIDVRYGVAKRLVPTGPNPLHN